MTCALRALNLCDGDRVETGDGALDQCLCEALRRANLYGPTARGLVLAERHARLIEKTMSTPLPLLPLDAPTR